ncbi:MAG: NAD(P)/FAD-dependent oxidoreductase [Chromatiaceae bacterium]|nr:NAD(P)/FAD-dependent oxidoreductase [Gammaproteobacteria bacterium]MCP5300844.1 NAD(P)/FAD-dependent oxidoreductase [Chromatiaceae bacterium]MCP5421683.1 NAD(P)/FAD-dependent oxidoreductase [Chromatiaceae bacterium]
MQYLIIGAGPAGVTAAETLRRLDADATIRIIGDEPEPPYSRMAIPYLLMDNIAEQGTHLREHGNHFADLRIDVTRGRVEQVDAAGHRVRLQDGGSLSYDSLLIATGSSPVHPPIPGIDGPNVTSCWTLADARRILAGARSGSRVVLIGAGFIGSIVLEALAQRGVQLSVVEQGERMVPRMMGPEAGGMLKRWCESKGVSVYTGIGVSSIDAGGVTLADDTRLEADLVITATGVKSNVGFLEGSGVKVDQGVLIDRHFRTNVADVYAAGDVAQGLDFSTGDYAVHAIQPTATDHGHIAALNMSGQAAEYEGSLNMNVLDTLGLLSCSFGRWDGVAGGEHAELYAPDDWRYLSLQFDGDRLVGANAVGLSQHVGILRGLIQRRTPLGEWKERLMRDPTRLMEAYLATTQVI